MKKKNRLLILVGPRAIGKTFWIEKLTAYFGGLLQIVRNTTTRAPRHDRESRYYEFVDEQEFRFRLVRGWFLEHDQYPPNSPNQFFYGSSRQEIERVLEKTHGIVALTPRGAAALWEHRKEFPISIIVFRHVSEEVLVRNLASRGMVDPDEVMKVLELARNYTVPTHVPHHVFPITLETAHDQDVLMDIVAPLILTPQ